MHVSSCLFIFNAELMMIDRIGSDDLFASEHPLKRIDPRPRRRKLCYER
jgi:hypothetical protein